MTEPTEIEAGWRVLDPDGNVVDSGPGMFLIAAGDSGPAADGTAPDDTEED
jgi:hypothetical protein